MPPLKRPDHHTETELPPRRATVAAETDVLVVGGGISGTGAAVGAARAGAEVIVAEQYGFLGGHATAALVTIMASYFTHETVLPASEPVLAHPAYSPQEAVIGGVLKQFVERLVAAGGAISPGPATAYTVPFDPEVFKLTAMDMLDDHGVTYLFHALASGVLKNGNSVEGVVFETKNGPAVIKAKCVIDCTGDGDVAAEAGAPYEIGRESDGLVQPITLMFIMGGFRQAAFDEYARQHPEQWYGNHGLWDLIKQATADGELNLPREDILFFREPRNGELSINSTRIVNIRGTDVWDLTFAEWEGRRQMRQIAAFLKRYVPGFERSYLQQSAAQAGARETRRIMGEYVLTAEDVLEARKFDDVVARGTYPIDIHNPVGKGTVLKDVKPGDAYDIPLRCLIPQRVESLLVAGRCISGTHEAEASYRVMPIAMATGQAAGVAAALAVKANTVPRDIPYADVQKTLLEQGANLGKLKLKAVG